MMGGGTANADRKRTAATYLGVVLPLLAGKSSAENGKEGIVLSVPDIGVVCSAEAAPTMCSRGGGAVLPERNHHGGLFRYRTTGAGVLWC